MSSVILGLLSLAIMIGGVLVASSLLKVVRKRMREGEREELRKQFECEMAHVLEPMIKEFRSKPRTPEEIKEFFGQVEEMFREWCQEYQKALSK